MTEYVQMINTCLHERVGEGHHGYIQSLLYVWLWC